jgi:hypothetical protein
VDPIRPFADLIRSLRSSRRVDRQDRTADAPVSESVSGVAASEPIAAAEALERALRMRLAGTEPWDASRAREVFVEHALLRDLGTGLATDPAFAELVAKVSDVIEQQPQISARLDVLLRQIAQHQTGR